MGEFFGFQTSIDNRESNGNELREIFLESEVEEEFHGFDTSVNLETIFLSDTSSSDEFFGF